MNYYIEIEEIIKKIEVNKRYRKLEENNDILTNYWHIGKLIVEAQGGEERTKYGNELIKKWSIKFTEKYGKGYDYTNLTRFRKLYLQFSNVAPLGQVSWTNIKYLIPIKDENKRNYYINLCITNNLSKRELEKEIKNNSYEKLINKPNKIEIIMTTNKPTIIDNIRNPIIIELNNNEKIENEKDLELVLLSKLKYFFKELGSGFTLVDNQYKINYNNKNYYIDILLFNYKLNSFIVVELKVRKLRREDKAQIEFYMKLIDDQVKEPFHNKTIGIIITKKQDKLIANFVENNEIIPITYQIKKEN